MPFTFFSALDSFFIGEFCFALFSLSFIAGFSLTPEVTLESVFFDDSGLLSCFSTTTSLPCTSWCVTLPFLPQRPKPKYDKPNCLASCAAFEPISRCDDSLFDFGTGKVSFFANSLPTHCCDCSLLGGLLTNF